MPWMAVPRNEKMDETVGCGLRGLETVRDGGAPYKIMVSATREVCQVGVPEHLQHCADVH
jgi:hypothetical protein